MLRQLRKSPLQRLQLFEDVIDGVRARAQVLPFYTGEERWFQDDFCDRNANRRGNPFHHRIRLGMHAGRIQRIVSASYAQKASRLLKRLRSDA